MADIRDDLLQQYAQTEYRVFHPDGNFILRVGVHSTELAALMRAHRASTAVFITACNPYSSLAPEDENANAMDALHGDIRECPYFGGEGVDPQGIWSAEPSFLVIGISHDKAITLATKYRQNAVLFSRHDAVPSLVLTAPTTE